MKLLNRIIFTLIFLLPFSNSFGAMVTEVDTDQSIPFLDGSAAFPNGIAFNPNGTKMFVSFQSDFKNEYDLSTPFDISTHSYAGDGERCNLANGWSAASYAQQPTETGDLTFSSDGLHIFVINRGLSGGTQDAIWRYDLTKPYDVSTCTLVQEKDPDQFQATPHNDDGTEINGWRFGSIGTNHKKHYSQGIAINPGPDWSTDTVPARSKLRLCFGHPDENTIKVGVNKLAKICQREFGVPMRISNEKVR